MSLRKLNVALAPESLAQVKVAPPPTTPEPLGTVHAASLAPGFEPRPSWNLASWGGRTIADLVFVNLYVGGVAVWAAADIERIDHALDAALSDPVLESVIAQYFPGPITSRMLSSVVSKVAVPATVYKETIKQIAKQVYAEGALGDADPAGSVINIVLPKGVVLSDDPASSVDSTMGLGGYHGSIGLDGGLTVCYAVGVYSETGNGVAAFDEPWKNVVAISYHQLNEARTDPDVEEVSAGGTEALLGWYSEAGQGEIGDLPVNACDGKLDLVFKEVPLANGRGTVPIQLMWSNIADGPALSV
jgi:hypothetical protein